MTLLLAILYFAFCASLGPLLDWEHERWNKARKARRGAVEQ